MLTGKSLDQIQLEDGEVVKEDMMIKSDEKIKEEEPEEPEKSAKTNSPNKSEKQSMEVEATPIIPEVNAEEEK